MESEAFATGPPGKSLEMVYRPTSLIPTALSRLLLDRQLHFCIQYVQFTGLCGFSLQTIENLTFL